MEYLPDQEKDWRSVGWWRQPIADIHDTLDANIHDSLSGFTCDDFRQLLCQPLGRYQLPGLHVDILLVLNCVIHAFVYEIFCNNKFNKVLERPQCFSTVLTSWGFRTSLIKRICDCQLRDFVSLYVRLRLGQFQCRPDHPWELLSSANVALNSLLWLRCLEKFALENNSQCCLDSACRDVYTFRALRFHKGRRSSGR